MKIPITHFSDEELSIFSVENIHKKYWDGFCEVCYPRFGFEKEEDEVRTNEQKYDTFSHCYNFIKEQFEWNEEQMLRVHEHDFCRLKLAYEFFLRLTTEDNAVIPMMSVILKMQQSIWNRLKEDGKMLEYIYPRKRGINYEQYKIEPSNNKPIDNRLIKDIGELETVILKELSKEREWDDEWVTLLEVTFTKQSIGCSTNNEKDCVEDVGSLARILVHKILESYNYSLSEFVHEYNDVFSISRKSIEKAMAFRLFTSYQVSLPKIKSFFENYPEHSWFTKLKEMREELVKEFKNTKLGKHWCECICDEKGLEKVGKYLISNRDSIEKQEEDSFFYTLDEICIITDILRGNASKYWLNIEYEEKKRGAKLNHVVLDYDATRDGLKSFLTEDWLEELRSDERYTVGWMNAFVDALISSPHGEKIVRDWLVEGREKRNEIMGYVLGLLKDGCVLKGSYSSIARKVDLMEKPRHFARYMCEGKKQPYVLWVKEYVLANVGK